jgi:aspartyl-tRNA(Asn)/glutamyl-tRNA(Gln) amidotransferase subunit A
VGAGLAPIALGTDAGGSVRIPAALCGVAGLKPTFGLISRRGMPRMVWSLDHIGLMAHTARDLADVLRAVAGPDESDPDMLDLPVGELPDPAGATVAGLRLGLVRAALDDASPEVAAAVRRAAAALTAAGATVVEVAVEHAELAHAAGVVILGCEGASAYEEDLAEHRERFGAEMQLLLEAARRIPAVDYLRAQRIRTLVRRGLERALADHDALLLPTTSRTAPPLRDDALSDGELDDELAAALSRWTFPANLAGLPAGTVPCGSDGDGLPIGLQVMGRAFDEATVLGIMHAFEELAPPGGWLGRGPRIGFDLLAGAR